MSSPTHQVSIRLTDNQHRWLRNAARYLEGETGCEVTDASLIMHLVEHGIPCFEDELTRLRARHNEGAKRFADLHIAL